MLRVDLHTHTSYSHDGHTPPAMLVERAREVGLDRVAVTDHGRLDGALEAKRLDPELVIVGEEIRCRCRTELIGLFLTERIPPRLSLEETAARIRDQGGVVYAPHPFAYAHRPLWKANRALRVADVIEGVNARAFLPYWNRAAQRAGRARGLPIAAGSDGHFRFEIGRAYTEMPSFHDARSFLEAVRHARPVHERTSGPWLFAAGLGLTCVSLVWEAPGRSSPSPAGRTKPTGALG